MSRDQERAEARAALQAWAEREGEQPTWRRWQSAPEGMPARSKLEALFGSWPAAMEACGFERRGPGQYPRKMMDRAAPCANPYCSDIVGARGINRRCYKCGRYLSAKGRERNVKGDRARAAELAREETISAVLELTRILGRAPSSLDWMEWEGRPCHVSIVFRRFAGGVEGGWRELLHAAGLEPRTRMGARDRIAA